MWARQTWSEAREALMVLLGRNELWVSASSCPHSACRKHQVLLRLGASQVALVVSESEATQSCPTLCDPLDCSLPGSSVHGIFQAIVLEWIALSFSRGSSQPRDWTQVSHIVDRRFTIWATREVLRYLHKTLLIREIQCGVLCTLLTKFYNFFVNLKLF